MKKIYKHKRLLLIVLLTVLIAGAILAVLINEYVKSTVMDKIISSDEACKLKADCILVLGAGVRVDGSPSPMLEDRLIEGINLYNQGASDRLLVSGDHGRKEYDEVNTMKQYAIERGISSEHVFMDHAGFSTYESLYRARNIFQAEKIIIVTQKYHLYRALFIAEALGIDAYGVSSDPRLYAGQDMREMREVAARVKDFFMALVKPYPSYLGDAIPVSGNGDLTND